MQHNHTLQMPMHHTHAHIITLFIYFVGSKPWIIVIIVLVVILVVVLIIGGVVVFCMEKQKRDKSRLENSTSHNFH